MHPEVAELQPKLKEILYDCAVEIRATKAALYLFDGNSRYELVTEYGFRNTPRTLLDRNDPVIDRCGRGKTVFFINGLTAEPRFSEILFSSQTERMLVAPLYSRGQLVGLIDMRDKQGKAPFEQTDVPKAQSIAERIIALFVNKNVFGHRFIVLSEAEGAQAPAPPSAPAAPANEIGNGPALRQVATTAPPPPAAPPEPAPRTHVPRLATLVLEARTIASRISIVPSPESMTESELTAARDALRSILLLPNAIAAMFSAYGHLGGVQEIAARGPLNDEAKNVLQSKLNVWLTKRGEGSGGLLRTTVQTPPGSSGSPIAAAQLQKVFTAPVVAGSLRGLYLTVAFAAPPERSEHELLAALLQQLQQAIEQAPLRTSYGSLRISVAEKLLEPDFARYPELRRHTDAVARLCEAFGRFLSMTPAELETIGLIARVHDVGMRLLDYERLYRKRDLSSDELGILREHVSVGAALVEPLLGSEVARGVLCHHERVDGSGYPNELRGDEIPLASRVLQLCDAWVAMTDPDTYQPPKSGDAAFAAISSAAGAQFDQPLAGRFIEMLRSAR